MSLSAWCFESVAVAATLAVVIAADVRAGEPVAPTPAGAKPATVEAPPIASLGALLTGFGKMKGLEARFVERKHLKLLVKPLVSEGQLFFTPPGYLARHVVKPKPAKLLITPKELRVVKDGGSEVIDLSARPDVKTFVASFSRLLAGDQAGLAKVYALKFLPSPGAGKPWTLTLEPRSVTLKKIIAKLTISGSGYAVSTIRVDETNGDYAVTTITKADPERVFTPAERKKLFGL